jgi:hypothetical protein
MTVTETGPGGRRPVILAAATLLVALAGLGLAFTAMMALFLGAEGPGIGALLALIAWLLLPTAGLAALSLHRLEAPGKSRFSACWARLPAWLVIAVALMLVLAMLAELAVWLTEFAGGGTVSGEHYLPVVAVLVCSLALTAGYALIAPTGEGGEHRGPVRHTDPVRRDRD